MGFLSLLTYNNLIYIMKYNELHRNLHFVPVNAI